VSKQLRSIIFEAPLDLQESLKESDLYRSLQTTLLQSSKQLHICEEPTGRHAETTGEIQSTVLLFFLFLAILENYNFFFLFLSTTTISFLHSFGDNDDKGLPSGLRCCKVISAKAKSPSEIPCAIATTHVVQLGL
jgi:hypothetical protein